MTLHPGEAVSVSRKDTNESVTRFVPYYYGKHVLCRDFKAAHARHARPGRLEEFGGLLPIGAVPALPLRRPLTARLRADAWRPAVRRKTHGIRPLAVFAWQRCNRALSAQRRGAATVCDPVFTPRHPSQRPSKRLISRLRGYFLDKVGYAEEGREDGARCKEPHRERGKGKRQEAHGTTSGARRGECAGRSEKGSGGRAPPEMSGPSSRTLPHTPTRPFDFSRPPCLYCVKMLSLSKGDGDKIDALPAERTEKQ